MNTRRNEDAEEPGLQFHPNFHQEGGEAGNPQVDANKDLRPAFPRDAIYPKNELDPPRDVNLHYSLKRGTLQK
jgi:hypothetical protein